MSKVAIPDRVGEPLQQYRMWKVGQHVPWSWRCPTPEFGELRPWNHPQIPTGWPGRQEFTATCNAHLGDRFVFPDGHQAPGPQCQCGIWAMASPKLIEQPLFYLLAKELERYAGPDEQWKRPWPPAWIVVGTVNLWGKVIEGSLGVRAEKAYPAELWLLPPARFGDPSGADDSKLVETGIALLHALRGRYGVSVGYVSHSPEWLDVISSYELGAFYGWRLGRGSRDAFGRALGEIGTPTASVATVADAVDRWLKQEQLWGIRRSVPEERLRPELGSLPLACEDHEILRSYRPTNPKTGRPYTTRTLERDRALLREVTANARTLGWAQRLTSTRLGANG